jgi:hypothetical protein
MTRPIKDLTDRELRQLLIDGRNALLYGTKRNRAAILERMHDAQTELDIRRLNAPSESLRPSESPPRATDKSAQ